MLQVGDDFDAFGLSGGLHIYHYVALASGSHHSILDVGRFEAMLFVVRNRVADVIHNNPREEAGMSVSSDKVELRAGAPKNAGVDAKITDDAVIFWCVALKNAKLGRFETIRKVFLNFRRVGNLVKEEKGIRLNDKWHLGGLFRSAFDDFALKANGEFA